MTIAVLFITLFGCMLMGMPIAIALGLSSVTTIMLFSNDSLASVALKLFEATSEHYTLLAIPFFILSSAFLSTGGVAKRLINFAVDSIGHVRGGLAMASVMACMLFAAVSGSSPATVAAIGTIVIAGMVRSGYPQSFAAGVIANAGTLGILIPPSIVMLVYAAATEVSASRMFMAGFIPGLMMGGLLMLAIYVVARIKGLPAQPFPGFRQLARSGVIALGGLMLIIIVLGSIYGGVASPTEAAAVAAVYGYLIAVIGYRDIGPMKGVAWRNDGENIGAAAIRNAVQILLAFPKSITHPEVRKVILDASKVSLMLLFIIANAMLFAHVLTTERIPHTIAETIIQWGLPAWGFLIVVNLLLLAAGNFMEPSAILLIMAPILFPIAMQLGIDPIHLGIVLCFNLTLGLISPPLGGALLVVSTVTGINYWQLARSVLPFLLVEIAVLAVLVWFPEITLWLPRTMGLMGEG